MMASKLFSTKKAMAAARMATPAALPENFATAFCKYAVQEHTLYAKTATPQGNSLWAKDLPQLPRFGDLQEAATPSTFVQHLPFTINPTFDRTLPSQWGISGSAFIQLSDMLSEAKVTTIDLGVDGNEFDPAFDVLKTPQEQLAWRFAAALLPFKGSLKQSLKYLANPSLLDVEGISLTPIQRRVFDHLLPLVDKKKVSLSPKTKDKSKLQDIDLELLVQLAAASESQSRAKELAALYRGDAPVYTDPRLLFIYVANGDAYLRSMEAANYLTANLLWSNKSLLFSHFRKVLATPFECKKNACWRNIVIMPIFSGLRRSDCFQVPRSANGSGHGRELLTKNSIAIRALIACFKAQLTKTGRTTDAVGVDALFAAIDDIITEEGGKVSSRSRAADPLVSAIDDLMVEEEGKQPVSVARVAKNDPKTATTKASTVEEPQPKPSPLFAKHALEYAIDMIELTSDRKMLDEANAKKEASSKRFKRAAAKRRATQSAKLKLARSKKAVKDISLSSEAKALFAAANAEKAHPSGNPLVGAEPTAKDSKKEAETPKRAPVSSKALFTAIDNIVKEHKRRRSALKVVRHITNRSRTLADEGKSVDLASLW